MKLKDLERYGSVIIQCHDNPDADALASGYGLYCYFQERRIPVRLVYGGRFPIHKRNLRKMVEQLEVPVEYVKNLMPPELLITVDCQYGGGNVTMFSAGHTVSIDHHPQAECVADEQDIRSNYGSCSTIIWELLLEAGFSVNDKKKLATALYYGLYCDTCNLSDIYFYQDKKMRDTIFFEPERIKELRGSNISVEEMKVAALALSEARYVEELRFCVIPARPCDPNVLGIVGDFILQTDKVDISVAYNEMFDGYKLSVRSYAEQVPANELIRSLVDGIGTGGGHMEKAGGFIGKGLLLKRAGVVDMTSFLMKKTAEYIKER